MLLGFLIVFISLFVVLVIGGIAFHQVYRRRRGGQTDLQSSSAPRGKVLMKVPRLADVMVEEKGDAIGKGRIDDDFQVRPGYSRVPIVYLLTYHSRCLSLS